MAGTLITVRCIGCGKTRTVDHEESRRLTETRDMPVCQTCWLPMVAEHARGAR